jgi:hypothetical protein
LVDFYSPTCNKKLFIICFIAENNFAVSQTLELDVLTLLDVACCWISSDLTTRESLFPTLLEIVAEWSSLSEEQIRAHLDSQPLYAASAESLSVVLENLMQQSRLPPHYQATYDALNNKVTSHCTNLI